jgi:hypothetical protein
MNHVVQVVFLIDQVKEANYIPLANLLFSELACELIDKHVLGDISFIFKDLRQFFSHVALEFGSKKTQEFVAIKLVVAFANESDQVSNHEGRRHFGRIACHQAEMLNIRDRHVGLLTLKGSCELVDWNLTLRN